MNSDNGNNEGFFDRLIKRGSPITFKRLIGLGVLSIFLLTLAVISAMFILKRLPGGQKSEPSFMPPPSLSELAEEYPQFSFLLDDTEIDSVYKEFLLVYQEGGAQAALELAETRGLLNANRELRLTLELDTTDTQGLIDSLETSGIRVTASSKNLVDIAVPLSLIEKAMLSGDPGGVFSQISGLEHVVRIRLPRSTLHDRGEVETESVSMINARTWHEAGFTGAGVKVGVLDLGFKRYLELLGSDLPETVIARSFIAGVELEDTDSEHGTAVGEIIHDIAPDAQLFFAAYDTDVEEYQAIDWLLEQGVQIISHSASSIYGPMDGSSIEARTVNQVVEGGVLWVNSAGNMGENHYRSVFVDDDGDGFHEFEPEDEMFSFSPDGGRVAMALNWNAWDTGDQDLDLFVLDADGNRIASSENYQSKAGDEAAEFISYRFSDEGPYFIAIFASNITREVILDFFIYNSSDLEYITPAYSVTTPGDAKLGLTVGATYWTDDSLEYYSSQGPTTDGRLKPDISGPAGVSSAAYGKAFYGTSASTPHVSGAAALVMSAYPGATVVEVKDFLLSRAIDLGASGADTQFGYGRLWLGDAPVLVAQPTDVPVEVVVPTIEAPIFPEITPPATVEVEPVIVPLPTVSPEEDEEETGWIWVVALLLCVVLPGFLGFIGIGVVLLIWLSRRKKNISRRSSVTPRPAPPSPKPAVVKENDFELPKIPEIQKEAWQTQGEDQTAVQEFDVGEKIKCMHCGKPNRQKARFCVYCGKDMQVDSAIDQAAPAYCIYCGQKLRSESKFCPNCGKSVH